MWGAYFDMSAYKCNVAVVIKIGASTHWVLTMPIFWYICQLIAVTTIQITVTILLEQ